MSHPHRPGPDRADTTPALQVIVSWGTKGRNLRSRNEARVKPGSRTTHSHFWWMMVDVAFPVLGGFGLQCCRLNCTVPSHMPGAAAVPISWVRSG